LGVSKDDDPDRTGSEDIAASLLIDKEEDLFGPRAVAFVFARPRLPPSSFSLLFRGFRLLSPTFDETACKDIERSDGSGCFGAAAAPDIVVVLKLSSDPSFE
jgi:hypothetical protein